MIFDIRYKYLKMFFAIFKLKYKINEILNIPTNKYPKRMNNLDIWNI